MARSKKSDKVEGHMQVPAGISDMVNKAIDKAISASFKYTRPLFSRMPSIDLVDKGDRLVLTADLPGVKKDDIKLRVEKDSVIISARSSESKEADDGDYYYNERKYTGYYRVVPLPVNVDAKSVKAHFENNTLHLEMKKAHGYGSYVKID